VTYDLITLQTLIFIVTPFFLMLALTSREDDDDSGPSGGIMEPII